jgi:hypothetical protein
MTKDLEWWPKPCNHSSNMPITTCLRHQKLKERNNETSKTQGKKQCNQLKQL